MTSTDSQTASRKYWIARGTNFIGVEVEFFTDPLAYGRAVKKVEAEHARDEVDTYTHGSNMINNDRKNPVYGDLYIASMGNYGADVEFFGTEKEYLKRLLDLKEDEYYQRVDGLSYNGPDVEFDPEAEDDADEDASSSMAM